MKLLIITQKIDERDPILGFFHEWVVEFAKHAEQVVAVCLEKGEHHLPSNVQVLSLGKERRIRSRVRYIVRFYKYIWGLRHEYDTVFIHMNQEYVLMAGLWWRLMGKRVYLWRNHAQGSWWTRVASLLVHGVFHTSPQAYVAGYGNAMLMPAGIDLARFKPSQMPVESNRILAFGRVAPVKRLDYFLDGLYELKKKRVSFQADIVGDASELDREYYAYLEDKIKDLKLTRQVKMLSAVAPDEAPEVYQQYKLFVNLTPDGSMDKTIFEALSTGLKVVVANTFFKQCLPTDWIIEGPEDPKTLAHLLKLTLNDSHSRNSETQARISVFLKEHGLPGLVVRLVDIFNTQ